MWHDMVLLTSNIVEGLRQGGVDVIKWQTAYKNVEENRFIYLSIGLNQSIHMCILWIGAIRLLRDIDTLLSICKDRFISQLSSSIRDYYHHLDPNGNIAQCSIFIDSMAMTIPVGVNIIDFKCINMWIWWFKDISTSSIWLSLRRVCVRLNDGKTIIYNGKYDISRGVIVSIPID